MGSATFKFRINNTKTVPILCLKVRTVDTVQWKLGITRSLGPGHFVCYIRYFVISVANKQYKTKEINSLGPEKLVCYIRYFDISDLFTLSFHCTMRSSSASSF